VTAVLGEEYGNETKSFRCGGACRRRRWYTGDCVSPSTPGTFTVPGGITGNIYDPTGSDGLVRPIATVNVLNQAIPFRPSADPINCGGTDPNGYADNSRWFNPASGNCEYSAKTLLTFNFPAGTNLVTGHDYVWTVAFNTTHSGYSYIGENTTCFAGGTPPGCGYDSLNVGYKNYPGAPYAGSDVDNDVVFLSHGGTPYSGALSPLASASGFAGYRPLGEIIVG
jgi:hypothetical protein